MRKAFALLLAMGIASAPFRAARADDAPASSAASPGYVEGLTAGEADARAAEGGMMWLVVGYCLPGAGILMAYADEPGPSPARLAGKPPDYVHAYVSHYARTGRNAQGRMAAIGCLGCMLTGIAWEVYSIATYRFY